MDKTLKFNTYRILDRCTRIKQDIEQNSKKVHALAHAVEQILCAKNLNLITPFAFQRNLMVCSITNSKDVARLTGCWLQIPKMSHV